VELESYDFLVSDVGVGVFEIVLIPTSTDLRLFCNFVIRMNWPDTLCAREFSRSGLQILLANNAFVSEHLISSIIESYQT